jgi:homoserine O-acetyltransferase
MLPSYEVFGPPRAPVTVVLGGISADAHVTRSQIDPSPGWWEELVGPGAAIDTRRRRVVSIQARDGGTRPDGRPARLVSTADQADAVAAVLDALAVPVAHAIVGASYGGMTALAFGARHAARARQLIVLGAAHESDPMTTARRVIQRQIVELGLDTGRPAQGLTLARALAMTTYRSRREFRDRFASPPGIEQGALRFPVEAYLKHSGDAYAATMSPARFLALSLSADCHRVTPSRITVPTTLVALGEDEIVPRESLVRLGAELGAPATLVDVPSRFGHDAFLLETRAISAVLADALSSIRSAA